MNKYLSIDQATRKTRDGAVAITATVGTKKVWFKFPGTMGTATLDVASGKWYGFPRAIETVKILFPEVA